MTTSLENFGTLEYVQDKYSKLWCWKITGTLAIDKISSLTSKAWYGESENEVIIEDTTESIKQLKLLMDRYPLEILSKTVWQRKIVKTYAPKPTLPPINHKLKRAKTGEQFRGKLMNFQKEGLDFPVRIKVTLGDSDSIILPFLLFFLRNFSISRSQLFNVTRGATIKTGKVCFSVETYDKV